ncbi:acyltransferase family protein [Butyrivibrio sp.]|uniref:acyltransferase family protein n=1 Tax=Butyrivibrio sp. TaxID=28121 RepID=UPI0025BB5F2C|nr:acyltransferase [Butyrivibrio sp.]
MNYCYEVKGGLQRYDEVTFLKGMSITTIVIMHLIQNYMRYLPYGIKLLASFGGTGVHVFFLCSGFGLYLSYLKRQTNYLDFLRKRFFKIYFPYIVIVIISFFVPLFYVNGNRLNALLSHVFLYKMFFPEFEETFGPFWFISTLFQLYFLFIPLCGLKKKIGRVPFCLICVLSSIVWWIFTSIAGINGNRIWGSFFLQYLWEFALGMLIAEYLYEGNDIKIPFWKLSIVCILGLLLEGVMGIKGGWLKVFNDIPALFGYGTLGLLLYQCKMLRRLFIWIGSISYEWYLVHILVFVLASTINKNALIALMVLLCSIMVAYVYHRLIAIVSTKLKSTL